jgi:TonB-dependent receptor
MRTYLISLLFILSFAGSQTLLAQGSNAKIVGVVTEIGTGEPLLGTNVAIAGTSLGASTGLDGGFSVPNIPPGTHTVVFRYIGFKQVEQEITLSAGQTLEINMELHPEAIQGEEVVITMQARGQRAAINQQLASNAITNIVSSDKIREVPDVNAAESIGRLPGVSLRRSGGEGSQVVVRGLSPQYTIVEVDGVRLQGVGLGRDVGLSTISSEMLDGIELSKTLTPDKDADAIGGVVNLRTRTAKEGFHFDVLAQGGYNHLESSLANYKFGVNVGNRFFKNRLGVLVSGTTEQVWRSSDRYTAGYLNENFPVDTNSMGDVVYEHRYYTQNENIREFRKLRKRQHGGLVLDWKNDFMTLKLNNTYSRMVDENEERNSQFRHSSDDYRHTVSDSKPEESIQSHSLAALFKLWSTELNLDVQYSKTSLDNHHDLYIFTDKYVVADRFTALERNFADPYQLMERYDLSTGYQAYMDNNDRTHTQREDITKRINLDWKIPYAIGDKISGNVKVGGSYSVKDRSSDVEAYRSYYWGGIGGGRYDEVIKLYPDFYQYTEPDYKPGKTMPARNFIDPDYEFGDVLNGITGIDLGWTADLDFLKEVHDYFGVDEEGNPKYPDDQTYGLGPASNNNDYSNREEYLAGFAMVEILIGKRIMLLPGVRYEQMNTTYSANYVVENANDPSGLQPGYPQEITVDDRSNTHFFPSLNAKVDITEWMDVRGAYYKSTSRPNYGLLSPGMVSNFDRNNINTKNPYLRPATAHNYDLGVSFFDNKLGLFTLNFFYKEITDLLYNIPKYNNGYFDIAEGVPASLMESFEAPRHLYPADLFSPLTGTANMNNFPVNNPNEASFIGFEASWQTNFWYLPGLLKGLVLDLNYTFIRSQTKYPYLDIWTEFTDDFPIPQKITHADYMTREGVMLDQPNSIYNALIGWDHKGFSTRLSFRYQGESLQGLNPINPNEDRYKKAHFRMDLLVKQDITDKLSVQLDIANLTNSLDEQYMSANGFNLPRQIEYYGLTSQLSLRYAF